MKREIKNPDREVHSFTIYDYCRDCFWYKEEEVVKNELEISYCLNPSGKASPEKEIGKCKGFKGCR